MSRRSITPVVVLAASLVLTAGATAFMALIARARDHARFENAVQATQDRIATRLEMYVVMLRGGAAVFSASDTITAAEFAAYVERLDIPRRYPGIQGVGFSARVDSARAGAVETLRRRDSLPRFRIWPDSARAELHTILYLEPLDRRNRAALGFDMYSEPTRRAAMQRARDTGQPAMSGKVTLVQEIEERKQAGFLIYVPVYRDVRVPMSLGERRGTLQGFVYSPFRAGDLFAGVFGSEEAPRVAFEVYDGVTTAADALLYDSGRELPAGHHPAFTATTTVELAGRTWTLRFRSLPAFEAASGSVFVPIIAVLGVLLSSVLYALTRAESAARAEAELKAIEARGLAGRLEAQAAELEQRVEEAQALAAQLQATNDRLTTATAAAVEARAEAEEANRAKSQFLATMSHELRTPLNAIAGYTELLEVGIQGPVTPGQREYLERIQRAQQHLLGLINDVLNFAKLEAGRVEFTIAPVPVEQTLQDIETLIAPQAADRGVRYHRSPGDPGVHVQADRDKLQQIVLNLLSNAIKFTPAGGEVELAWRCAAGAAEIEVRDTGIGIAPERLPTIFEPFVQINAELTRTNQGTGLGLTISRDLARMMGGDLTARSTPGRGSSFLLSLPCTPAAGAAVRARSGDLAAPRPGAG